MRWERAWTMAWLSTQEGCSNRVSGSDACMAEVLRCRSREAKASEQATASGGAHADDYQYLMEYFE